MSIISKQISNMAFKANTPSPETTQIQFKELII